MAPTDAADAEVRYVNGRPASTLVRQQTLLTAPLDPGVLTTPGTLTLDLRDPTGRIVAPLGTLTVKAASSTAD